MSIFGKVKGSGRALVCLMILLGPSATLASENNDLMMRISEQIEFFDELHNMPLAPEIRARIDGFLGENNDTTPIQTIQRNRVNLAIEQVANVMEGGVYPTLFPMLESEFDLDELLVFAEEPERLTDGEMLKRSLPIFQASIETYISDVNFAVELLIDELDAYEATAK